MLKPDPLTRTLGAAAAGHTVKSSRAGKTIAAKPSIVRNIANKSDPTKFRNTPARDRLHARIVKLLEIHKQIAADVKNRCVFMNLFHHDGRYCVTCGPNGSESTCGPTCPLLRPGNGNGLLFQFNQHWWDKAVIIAEQHTEVLRILEKCTPEQIGSCLLDQYDAIADDAHRFGSPISHNIQDHETWQKITFTNPFDNNRPC
ncbi:hypothetical protein IAQ61_007065 [Plenodomus lingam]|uniref:uncharacterized protein n=1 Tax=Leptosphaeria maculans TaxID=5022 RepID=UPI00332A81B1|nr:hypothetical protein IAQ61_007065 [Plenodomus lingam]